MTANVADIHGPAVVTGGGQGIGRAFCHALAERGAAIAVADLNSENAERVASEIVSTGGQAVAVQVDVADPESVKAMRAEVVNELGAPVVLVNNAAIFSTLEMRPFGEIPFDEWRRVMDVNIGGAFLCCRELVPDMTTVGYGKIVNISSASIWIGRTGYLHYVTSKAALIGFTRALAAELGPGGVRVNVVTPGSTRTEIKRETITTEAHEAMVSATALRRIQTPADLVGAILFLASSASDFITGQTLNVDGGYTFH